MKINANINLKGDFTVDDTTTDSIVTIVDNTNGGTLSIESSAVDNNNVQAGTINFDPGESTGAEVAASITAQSSGATATNRGGKITIKTKSDNGNLLNRLFIDKDSLETENLLTANINATTANINATTVNLQSGGATKLTTNNNYVTAAVPIALPDGSASAPVLTNAGDENTGIYFGATDTVNIATNGIERLNINNSTITAGRNIDMQSTYQLTNLPDPTTNQQAVTKIYADSKIIGTTQTFTSSGTWTKPAGARKVEITAISAGGGGGTISGGGGGAYSTKILDASSLTSSVSVTVGSGGIGGAAGTSSTGTAGGNSSFGSYVISYGGAGGTGVNSFPSGGVGGSALYAGTGLALWQGTSSVSGCFATVYAGGFNFNSAAASSSQSLALNDYCGLSVYGGGGAGGYAYVVNSCGGTYYSSLTPVAGGSSVYGGGGGGAGGTHVTSCTNCSGNECLATATISSDGGTGGSNSGVRGGGGSGGTKATSGTAQSGGNGGYLAGGGGGGSNSSTTSGTFAGAGGNGGVGGGGGGGGRSLRSSSAGNGKGGDGGRGEVIVITYF